MKCAECDFWERIGKDPIGICRRFPPIRHPVINADMMTNPGVTMGALQQAKTAWPITGNSDWCGEFK